MGGGTLHGAGRHTLQEAHGHSPRLLVQCCNKGSRDKAEPTAQLKPAISNDLVVLYSYFTDFLSQ